MTRADKSPFLRFNRCRGSAKLTGFLSILLTLSLAGCDRMVTPRNAQLVREADAKAKEGDFLWAINLYEAALDGTPQSAEIHYKLALLYDDKMNDPLNALHHFKRYLILNSDGTHANEAKDFMKRDQIMLATSLSGDSVITRAEAARLRNENLNLRKEVEERSSRLHAAEQIGRRGERRSDSENAVSKKSAARSYVVQDGDTLASISRKFYKTSVRWKEILDANKKKIDDPENLKVGQSLTIPSD